MKWAVNVIVKGKDGRDTQTNLVALEALLGKAADATGVVIRADGTPGECDASWWFEEQSLAGMAREVFDDAHEEGGEQSPIVAITGPEQIG